MNAESFDVCFKRVVLAYWTGNITNETLDSLRLIFSNRTRLISRLIDEEISKTSEFVPDEEIEKKIFKYWKFYHQSRLN